MITFQQIQGEFLTKIFKVYLTIIILLLASFAFVVTSVDQVEAEKFDTFNTGVVWTTKQLAVNSSGTVTGTGSVFYVHDMLTVMPKDTWIIQPGTIIKVDKDVLIDIKGTLLAMGTNNNTIKFTTQ